MPGMEDPQMELSNSMDMPNQMSPQMPPRDPNAGPDGMGGQPLDIMKLLQLLKMLQVQRGMGGAPRPMMPQGRPM